jgi:hypothetical protein
MTDNIYSPSNCLIDTFSNNDDLPISLRQLNWLRFFGIYDYAHGLRKLLQVFQMW